MERCPYCNCWNSEFIMDSYSKYVPNFEDHIFDSNFRSLPDKIGFDQWSDDIWKLHIKNCVKRPPPAKLKSYLYLTLSPDKILRNMDNTPENCAALNTWCKNWFANNPKFNGIVTGKQS